MPISSRSSMESCVEKEADGSRVSGVAQPRDGMFRFRACNYRPFFQDPGRTESVARTVPGDKFLWQASAPADDPVP